MGSREHVSFLAGSDNRVRILETLRENPARQCELIRDCGLSRSTVHRALSGLTAREWVRRENGTYHLTPGGSFVLDRYEALETTIDRVAKWGPFLNRLGAIADSFPLSALDDATLLTVSPANPHAALSRFANAFAAEDIERFYGITPVVSPVINDAAAELLTDGIEMELLVDDSVLDTSRASYADALDDAYSSENFALFRYPDDLDFGIAVFDDRVIVSAYDDRGVLRECLDSTDDALGEWAREVYDDYRASASRVDVAAPTE